LARRLRASALALFLFMTLPLPAGATDRLAQSDLDPIFTDPPARAAAALVNDGKYTEARKALLALAADGRTPAHPERIRFLLGIACVESRDWLGATVALSGLEGPVPEAADRIRVLRARALHGLSRMDEALAALDGVQRKSAVWAESRLLRARILADHGKAGEAADVYSERVASGRRDPETVGLYAQALVAAGRKADAVRELRKAYFESASSGRTTYKRMLADLGAGLDPSEAERLTHAQALLDAQSSESAATEAAPLLKSGTAGIRCGAFQVRGGAFSKLRKHSDALEAWKSALEICAADDRARILFNATRSAYRSDRRSDGDGFAARLRKEFPASTLNDDVSVWRARSAIGRGDVTAANAILGESLKQWPGGDMAAESRWLLAWGAIRADDLERAGAQLSAGLKAHADDPEYGSRFAYWSGRVLDQQKKKPEADVAYRDCAARYPMTFYGILALNRFSGPGKAGLEAALKRVSTGTKAPQGPFLSVTDPNAAREGAVGRALWLLRSGVPDLAAEELAGQDASGSDEAWVSAAALDAGRNYTRSHRLAAGLIRKGRGFWPDADSIGYYRLAYPRPFLDFATAAAKESGVEVALIYGVMREESAFVAGVESRANAIGLMQLILPTAKSMAARIKVTATPETLRKPETNIRLGAAFLSILMKEFKEPILAIPGYNAGGGAIRGWLANHPGVPLDVFVESIGAQETRDYARKVFESYAAYRYLYGTGADRLTRVRFR
jgi:soluble lytic murein transglycosylase